MTFKVIAFPTLRYTPEALALADSRACAEALPRRGAPRTDREWTALVKIASGEVDVQPSERARLMALGLICSRFGFPELTPHGRLTLGLAA